MIAPPFVAEGDIFDGITTAGPVFQTVGHARGISPGGEELIEQRLLSGTRRGVLKLCKHAGYGAGLGGGLLQLTHVAGTA